MSRVLDLHEQVEGQLGRVALRACSGGVPTVPLPYVTGLCVAAKRSAVLRVHSKDRYELIIYANFGRPTEFKAECYYATAALATERMDEWLGLR